MDHVNQVYLLLSSFVLFDTALVMSRCWRWEVCRAQMCKVKTSSGEVDEQFFSMVWLSIWFNLLIEILFPSLNLV